MRLKNDRPSKVWTDDDPEFARRIGRIATAMMYGADLPEDTDPLDVAAAKLWLEYILD